MAEYDLYTIARFWAKVKVGKPAACWPWQGGANDDGYGRFKIGGRLFSPHRVAWEIANGPIPAGAGYHGTVVRHACDNPLCCNWRHLKIGSQADNVLDMDIQGRRAPRSRKITVDEIAAIIADPRLHREIAADYGLSKTHVGAIKRGDRNKLSRRTAQARQESLRPTGTMPQQGSLL